MMSAEELLPGLTSAMERAGYDAPTGLERLTGGATMESWRFSVGEEAFVLRRAPSLEFMEDRPYGHDVEAAVIRAAHKAGVTAPEVVAELEPDDDIGSGFVMQALSGTPNPKMILEMDDSSALLAQIGRDLARIHSISRENVPKVIPKMDYRAAISEFCEQFEEAGGDRPIIALGIKWLEDNCPEECEPVLNHGDYRMGNLLAEDGKLTPKLTGVLDWELAHFGDPHEDLAFGCMAVWRFHRYDRPALGLGSLEDYFAAYEAAGGAKVDPKRFRYWTIHRTVWWALGCLKMAKFWRSGEDRMLERVVISRRTSEQELDLLMLLEEDAPQAERSAKIAPLKTSEELGEASIGEIATAVSEWLATIKDQMEGHNRFQLAVARNALGMIARENLSEQTVGGAALSAALLAGDETLESSGLLAELRLAAFQKLSIDVPKYPALAVARKKWPIAEDNGEE